MKYSIVFFKNLGKTEEMTQEQLMFFQKFCVQFPAPIWGFSTVSNSGSRVSNALLWYNQYHPHMWERDMHAGKVPIAIKISK